MSLDNEADENHGILVAIESQTRTILELMRSIVDLMTPKGERKEPTLEQLLAAIMAQQREIITEIWQTRETILQVTEALPQAVAEALAQADRV